MFAAAMTAGVASKGCGLLSSTKYEACYSSGAFLRSRTVAGEWGFGGQLKVFCPNKNAPETWTALAVADVKGSKWELTGEILAAAGSAGSLCCWVVAGWRQSMPSVPQ